MVREQTHTLANASLQDRLEQGRLRLKSGTYIPLSRQWVKLYNDGFCGRAEVLRHKGSSLVLRKDGKEESFSFQPDYVRGGDYTPYICAVLLTENPES